MRGDEIFFHRQTLEYLATFGAMGQPHSHDLFRSGSGYILTFKDNRTGCNLRNPGNRVQQRCFSCTIRSENYNDFLGVDLKIDIIKYADASVSRA